MDLDRRIYLVTVAVAAVISGAIAFAAPHRPLGEAATSPAATRNGLVHRANAAPSLALASGQAASVCASRRMPTM